MTRRREGKCIQNNDNDDWNWKKKTANSVERRTMKNVKLNRLKSSWKLQQKIFIREDFPACTSNIVPPALHVKWCFASQSSDARSKPFNRLDSSRSILNMHGMIPYEHLITLSRKQFRWKELFFYVCLSSDITMLAKTATHLWGWTETNVRFYSFLLLSSSKWMSIT